MRRTDRRLGTEATVLQTVLQEGGICARSVLRVGTIDGRNLKRSATRSSIILTRLLNTILLKVTKNRFRMHLARRSGRTRGRRHQRSRGLRTKRIRFPILLTKSLKLPSKKHMQVSTIVTGKKWNELALKAKARRNLWKWRTINPECPSILTGQSRMKQLPELPGNAIIERIPRIVSLTTGFTPRE